VAEARALRASSLTAWKKGNMNEPENTNNTSHADAPASHDKWMERIGRNVILGVGAKLREGRLAIIEGNDKHVFGNDGHSLETSIHVHSPRFYRRSLFGGDIGIAESYMDGDWTCSDLTALVRIMCRQADVLDELGSKWFRLSLPLHRMLHRLRDNRLSRSRRNIAEHYDLSNDFFALFLDDTMTYSCGIYTDESASLRDAQLAKMDRLCQKLELSNDDHLLEIGTGWGAMAMHAASNYGCRVTTTTLSKEQAAFARKRIADEGLSDRIDVIEKDYRRLNGTFDKLVSVEMIEAVGWRYMESFFRKCSELLKPEGLMALQAIVISDYRHEASKRTVDFISRYIFPGGCLPSLTSMCTAMSRATDMRVVHLEDLASHYARTLRDWRSRFFDRISDVRTLGFPDSFINMWEYYLCYCEGGFAERLIGDVQILFAKPRRHNEPILPPL
jgi:cyclopropane-fatty-acyl-phospholipid synthase